MGVKPLRIRFDEVYEVIKIYDVTRDLELLGSWFYNRIYDRSNYLKSEKSNYKYGLNHNFARIRINFFLLFFYENELHKN